MEGRVLADGLFDAALLVLPSEVCVSEVSQAGAEVEAGDLGRG